AGNAAARIEPPVLGHGTGPSSGAVGNTLATSPRNPWLARGFRRPQITCGSDADRPDHRRTGSVHIGWRPSRPAPTLRVRPSRLVPAFRVPAFRVSLAVLAVAY